MTKVSLTSTVLPSTGTSPLAFAAYRGERAVLLLGNRMTVAAVQALARRLLSDAATADVPVLQVAHLAAVPRPLQRMAERDIRLGAIDQELDVRRLRADRGHSGPLGRLLRVGLDWTGELTTQLGFSARDTRPLATVVDEDGNALDPVSGSDQLVGLWGLLAAPATTRR